MKYLFRTNFFTAIAFMIAVMFASAVNAQSSEKIKKINGKILKIVITSSEGETVFEGKEAEELFSKLKAKEKTFAFFSGGDKHDGNVKVVTVSADKDMHWVSADNACMDSITKNIEVNIEDGDKKVVVTTTKDGNENVEVYTGEDAEKWLEEHEAGGEDEFVWVEGDEYFGDKENNVIVKKLGGCDKDGKEKKVDVKVEDGKIKVTITTTDENGEEKVETFEGDDAEEYLEKLKGDDAIILHKFDNDGDSNVFILKTDGCDKDKKVYKIKIEEDDGGKAAKTIKIRKKKVVKEEDEDRK